VAVGKSAMTGGGALRLSSRGRIPTRCFREGRGSLSVREAEERGPQDGPWALAPILVVFGFAASFNLIRPRVSH
jgi:hypothetical protein